MALDKENYDEYLRVLKGLTDTCPPYRGYVEVNDCKCGPGYVKVRIPSLHGIPNVTDTWIDNDSLPEAPIAAPSMGEDRGSFLPCHVGDICLVTLENGIIDLPIVIGFLPRIGIDVDKVNANPNINIISGGTRTTSGGGSGAPKDVVKAGNAVAILYKSAKGAEIGMYEQDGKETMRFIDGLGQIMEFGYQKDPTKSIGARASGDRTRTESYCFNKWYGDDAKPVSKDQLKETGYILLQNANTSGEDSKLVLSDDLVEIENGVSNISLEKDQVTIYNGKMVIKITDDSAYMASGPNIIAITTSDSKSELGNAAISAVGSAIGAEGLSGGGGDSITMTNGKCVFKMQGENMVISAPDTINISAGKFMNLTSGTALTITCGVSMIVMGLNSLLIEGMATCIGGLATLKSFAGTIYTHFSGATTIIN